MTRAVFLDRDDTLITNPVDSAGEWQCFPEVQRACGELHTAGFFLVLVTNQPDISRGLTTISEQCAIHDVIRTTCHLDAIYVCPHTREDACACRKPAPGMLFAAAAQHGIDLRQSWMIGDRETDVLTGHHAGCNTVRIDRGDDDIFPSTATLTARSLLEAARTIVGRTRKPYLQWGSHGGEPQTGVSVERTRETGIRR